MQRKDLRLTEVRRLQEDMPNENRKQNTSGVFTATAIGIGAIAAVGSYLYGKYKGAEEVRQETEARHQTQAHRHTFDDAEKPEKSAEQARECGICFREFERVLANDEEIHTTPCGHIFCKHCLDSSIRAKPECPFCRRPVEAGQSLRIYL